MIAHGFAGAADKGAARLAPRLARDATIPRPALSVPPAETPIQALIEAAARSKHGGRLPPSDATRASMAADPARALHVRGLLRCTVDACVGTWLAPRLGDR
jgi:hypothetical protein